MTRDECKDLLVQKINELGGVRSDELAAWTLLYTIEGFPQVFHPDMFKQLLVERRIAIIEYTLPGKDKPFAFLLPVNTKIETFNV